MTAPSPRPGAIPFGSAPHPARGGVLGHPLTGGHRRTAGGGRGGGVVGSAAGTWKAAGPVVGHRSPRTRGAAPFAAALAVGFLWSGCLPGSGDGDASGGVGASAEAVGGGDPVSVGASLYADHCASCHGSALEGQPDWRTRLPDGRFPAPPHDETGHTWHHDDAYLFSVTKRGGQALAPPGFRSGMPAFDGVLSDDEIRAVLAFIKSRWPPEIRAWQQRVTRSRRTVPERPTRPRRMDSPGASDGLSQGGKESPP